MTSPTDPPPGSPSVHDTPHDPASSPRVVDARREVPGLSRRGLFGLAAGVGVAGLSVGAGAGAAAGVAVGRSREREGA
ncbi:MAG: hypothetical protein QM591_09420, partial [Microbacterium sp.]